MKSFRLDGFSLLELLITVAIIALLAGIAYPSYQQQILRTRRSEGQAALLQAAAREEQFFLDNRTYTADLRQLGYASNPALSEQGYYQIRAINVSATGYTLEAIPRGPQAADTLCGTLSLTSLGTKGESGTGAVTDCW
ncbi:MAG TPA: type IV pilin protein [bacterium]|nr:type IV pilin protein [bacterium]